MYIVNNADLFVSLRCGWLAERAGVEEQVVEGLVHPEDPDSQLTSAGSHSGTRHNQINNCTGVWVCPTLQYSVYSHIS